MMREKAGLLGMIGKGRARPGHDRVVYLMAVGSAAFLVSKAIRNARVGCVRGSRHGAIREFEVENMPVTVAEDSIHVSGPREWRARIGVIPAQPA